MNKNFQDLTFGCDPETFAVNGLDEVISPGLMEYFNIIHRIRENDNREYTEKNKHPIYLKTDDYWWIMDGVAFELTLLHPYKNPEQMALIISQAIEHLKKYISEIKYKDVLQFSAKPVVNIRPEIYTPFLNDDVVYQGFIYGCDPDHDVTEEKYKCKQVDASKDKFRYGGGHIHFGGNSDQVDFMHKNWNPMVKLLAITVGNICVTESIYPDLDLKRVGQYGRPGRFRLPPHGVEYRSPSNSWMNKLDTLHKIFDGGKKAWEFLFDERVDIIDKYFVDTCYAINHVDQQASVEILKQIGM